MAGAVLAVLAVAGGVSVLRDPAPAPAAALTTPDGTRGTAAPDTTAGPEGAAGPDGPAAGPALGTLAAGARPARRARPTATPTRPAPTSSSVPAPAPAPGPAAVSAKKGASIWKSAGMAAALKDAGASWFYSWGPDPKGVSAPGVEFVPMIWGASSADAATIARAKASGRTLLGFNEPDLAGQAEMTVEQALELWPRLEATGMRLGAPAVAYGADTPGGWLDRFMAGAQARGHRVDFIPVHWYGGDFRSGPATDQLKSYLQRTHARYGKPIWLTEYALMRFGPTVYPGAAEQAAFVRSSTAMLAGLSFVERYAWFSLATPDEGGDGTGLYRPDGTPTAAGAAYRTAR